MTREGDRGKRIKMDARVQRWRELRCEGERERDRVREGDRRREKGGERVERGGVGGSLCLEAGAVV